MVVAEVDGQRIDLKFSRSIDIKLAEDFASNADGTLSEKIKKDALNILKDLKMDAVKHGAQEYAGISTAVFRKAKNGEALLAQLKAETGINLQVVSQEKEGAFGFNTAAILSPELKEQDMISWDSGNASFQITAKGDNGYLVYEGPLGNGLVAKALVEEVRGIPFTKDATLNPISISDCKKLARVIKQKITLPDWLKKKLSSRDSKVIAIGDDGSIFAMPAKGLGTNCYTTKQVKQLIQKLAGSSNAELIKFRSDPETVITRLILLQTVMEKFNIDKVIYKESTGSTLGLLIDSDLWK